MGRAMRAASSFAGTLRRALASILALQDLTELNQLIVLTSRHVHVVHHGRGEKVLTGVALR